MLNKIAILLATFFGSGLSPIMPGTVGSLASLAIWGPMVMYNVSWIYRLIAVTTIFIIGIWASKKGIAHFNTEDPKPVVIDEVAGQGLALLIAGPSLLSILLGFVFFRIFDIIKPWPISVIQRRIHGGFGVMIDDIAAGAIALIIVTAFECLT